MMMDAFPSEVLTISGGAGVITGATIEVGMIMMACD